MAGEAELYNFGVVRNERFLLRFLLRFPSRFLGNVNEFNDVNLGIHLDAHHGASAKNVVRKIQRDFVLESFSLQISPHFVHDLTPETGDERNGMSGIE